MNIRWAVPVSVVLAFLAVIAVLHINKPQAERKPINLGPGLAAPAPAPTSAAWPGEFDKQQALWLQWPSDTYNSNDRPVNPVIVNIIKAVAPTERVNILTQDSGQSAAVRDLLTSSGYSGKNVFFYNVNHLSIWARDVGPIFVRGSNSRLQVVDFGFNNYSRGGSPNYLNIESQVDRQTAGLLGLPVVASKLISEGGAIESNGRGTMMVTEAVALKRNPGMTKQQIEAEYKRVLGVTKVIWLNKGLAEDAGITSGHINEIARFANPTTILLAQVLPQDRYTNSFSANSYLNLEENYRILSKATDQNGKAFRIIRIPMPPTLYAEMGAGDSIPVRSYLNYAVTNQAVLLQNYWRPGRSQALKTAERQVATTFRSLFPGRKIVGINAETVNLWGGGIHCITQHMPSY